MKRLSLLAVFLPLALINIQAQTKEPIEYYFIESVRDSISSFINSNNEEGASPYIILLSSVETAFEIGLTFSKPNDCDSFLLERTNRVTFVNGERLKIILASDYALAVHDWSENPFPDKENKLPKKCMTIHEYLYTISFDRNRVLRTGHKF